MKIACDHYLDLGLGLREASDEVVIWPCPSCGRASFEARFEVGTAGCSEQDCEIPASMGLTELVACLDREVAADDIRRANERFAEIFEAAVGHEQERENQRKERNRRVRNERKRRKESAETIDEDQGFSEQHLF